MSNLDQGQEPTPQGQEPEGQEKQEEKIVEAGKDAPERPTLTAEELAAALAAVRNEAADTRRKLRAAEAQIESAKKAKAEADEAAAKEQGKFKELYEAQQAKTAELESTLRRMESDQQRREAAQAAGIPQLWERLKGETPEELAEDAKTLAELMQPPVASENGPQRPASTKPTPVPQGNRELTPEERRRTAAQIW